MGITSSPTARFRAKSLFLGVPDPLSLKNCRMPDPLIPDVRQHWLSDKWGPPDYKSRSAKWKHDLPGTRGTQNHPTISSALCGKLEGGRIEPAKYACRPPPSGTTRAAHSTYEGPEPALRSRPEVATKRWADQCKKGVAHTKSMATPWLTHHNSDLTLHTDFRMATTSF